MSLTESIKIIDNFTSIFKNQRPLRYEFLRKVLTFQLIISENMFANANKRL